MQRAPIGALCISSGNRRHWPALTPPTCPVIAPPLTNDRSAGALNRTCLTPSHCPAACHALSAAQAQARDAARVRYHPPRVVEKLLPSCRGASTGRSWMV
jgi:hypothetical protein